MARSARNTGAFNIYVIRQTTESGLFQLAFVTVTATALSTKVLNDGNPLPLVRELCLVLLIAACFLCLAGLTECRAMVRDGRVGYFRSARTALVGAISVAMHFQAAAPDCFGSLWV